MAQFSLACYTIRVRRRGARAYLRFNGLRDDPLDLFVDYLEALREERTVDDVNQRLLKVTRIEPKMSQRMASGIVQNGQFGYRADLYDVDEDAVSYTRTPTEAEMMPFYFLAFFPPRRSVGVLILQRRAQFGIRTTFLQDFAKYIRGQLPNTLVEFNPLVTQGLLNQYMRGGRLTKVTFVRFDVPSDITDVVAGDGHTERAGRAEFTISAGRDRALNLLDPVLDVALGRRPVKQMVELQDIVPGMDFEYDTVKVELELGGSRRTIYLSNIMKLRAYYDISEDVQVNRDGHPVFSSIEAIALDLMDDLRESLNNQTTLGR